MDKPTSILEPAENSICIEKDITNTPSNITDCEATNIDVIRTDRETTTPFVLSKNTEESNAAELQVTSVINEIIEESNSIESTSTNNESEKREIEDKGDLEIESSAEAQPMEVTETSTGTSSASNKVPESEPASERMEVDIDSTDEQNLEDVQTVFLEKENEVSKPDKNADESRLEIAENKGENILNEDGKENSPESQHDKESGEEEMEKKDDEQIEQNSEDENRENPIFVHVNTEEKEDDNKSDKTAEQGKK